VECRWRACAVSLRARGELRRFIRAGQELTWHVVHWLLPLGLGCGSGSLARHVSTVMPL
jgi:hypothetical protein